MEIDPATVDVRAVYRLMVGAIVPRPIALVTTVDDRDVVNAAPFSYFMGICPETGLLGFAVGPRRGPGSRKDTLLNVQRRKEFVVNVVTEEMAEAVDLMAADFARGLSEPAAAGFRPIRSSVVTVPRLAECPVNLECSLVDIHLWPGATYRWVVGRVVCYHVLDALVQDGRILTERLRPLARLGGNVFGRVAASPETPDGESRA